MFCFFRQCCWSLESLPSHDSAVGVLEGWEVGAGLSWPEKGASHVHLWNTSPGVGQSSPTGPVAGGAVGGSGLLGEM